jgi:UDP-N-acetylglucosamine 2-epimerase (non-hydrolysing)
MHILHVVGARPNFMKAAPVLRALAASPHSTLRQTLVHTGQHYDAAMSSVFFQQLEMPAPDLNLGVGSGSHASQTAEIMRRFEPVVNERKPDLVLVYGDVNSTLAAALVCSQLALPVAHVEAGLRSRDRSMPEEINRLLTDQISDFLFTPSSDADQNLLREGVDAARIHFVGNVMIDTLVRLLPQARRQSALEFPAPYILVTLHRPSNVDDLPWLRELIIILTQLSHDLTVVFPVHPRTRQQLQKIGIPHPGTDEIGSSETGTDQTGTDPTGGSETGRDDPAMADPDKNHSRAITSAASNLRLLGPQPYLEFLALQSNAALVITDSGGVQEETTFLGVPCLTVRENTERPITVTLGTNQLVGRNLDSLRNAVRKIIAEGKGSAAHPHPRAERVPLWDGHAAERIAQILLRRA